MIIGVFSSAVFMFAGTGAGQESASASAGSAPGGAVPLEISAADSGMLGGVLCPPPGEYDIPKGDTVLLQGRSGAGRDRGPLWSGDASGTGCVVPLQMNGPRRVSASFGEGTGPSGDSAPAFDVPEQGALHAFLGSGGMYGWFSAARNSPALGAGITHLFAADTPYTPVFTRPNLNFEHIMNGAAADYDRSQNTPRTDPMQVRVLSPACVEVCWPAATSSWGIDCRMCYTFTGDNAIDMDFEAIPRRDEAPKGWLLFMWASYMQAARARTLYFRGTDGDGEKWVSFGKTGTSGTVAGAGQPELPVDAGPAWFNVCAVPGVRFTLPFYYGLRDGDMNPGTTDDTTAFIMMFDDPMNTRFAVWNWGEDPAVSAWDWQFVVRNPEIGRSYHHRARMVCKRFAGGDDVLAEYQGWRDRLSAGVPPAPLPVTAPPFCLAPGNPVFSRLQILDKAVSAAPVLAAPLCREMLACPLYAADAANRIDACAEQGRGAAAAAEIWDTIVAGDPGSTLARRHLGLARERLGELEKAAAAYTGVLETDASDTAARFRLGMIRIMLGDTDAGLALADEAVQKDGTLGETAAGECMELGKARAASKDMKSAIALYGKAIAWRPHDYASRMIFGEALESAGDGDNALEQYRIAAGGEPDSNYAASRIDAVYSRRGDTPGLVAEWTRLRGAHPEEAVPEFHLGMALEAAGDAAGANAAYQEVLRLHPDRREAKARLGGLAAAAGDIESGLRMIEASAEDAASDIAAIAAAACGDAAQRRVAEKDFSGAVSLLRCAIRLSPADLRWHAALGGALEAGGDSAGAESAYREALRLQPQRQDLNVTLGAVVAGKGGMEEGLRLMDGAVRAVPELAGAAAEACGRAAGVRSTAGDMPGSALLLRHAREFAPADRRWRVALGDALTAAGDDAAALAEYRAVVAEVPESPHSCGQIDAALRRSAGPAARVAEWRRCVEETTDSMLPRLYLGMALEDAGDGAGAAEVYREALRLHPQEPEPRVRLGMIAAGKGDVEGGLKLTNEAVAAKPELGGQAAETCGRAAKCRLDAGDAPGALVLLRRARELSPGDLRFRVALGGALEAAGDDDGALAEYRAVVAAEPESPMSSNRIDAIYQRRNDPAARVGEWRRAAGAHPDAAWPLLHLGLALEAAGDLGAAETAYRGALSRNAAVDADSAVFRRAKQRERGAP